MARSLIDAVNRVLTKVPKAANVGDRTGHLIDNMRNELLSAARAAGKRRRRVPFELTDVQMALLLQVIAEVGGQYDPGRATCSPYTRRLRSRAIREFGRLLDPAAMLATIGSTIAL